MHDAGGKYAAECVCHRCNRERLPNAEGEALHLLRTPFAEDAAACMRDGRAQLPVVAVLVRMPLVDACICGLPCLLTAGAE